MAQGFKQIVYRGVDSNFNTDETITAENLINGTIFNSYIPIIQLSIQAPFGTKFVLNDSSEPIIIGSDGIFSVKLNLVNSINKIQFDSDSIQRIINNDKYVLIINIIYEQIG